MSKAFLVAGGAFAALGVLLGAVGAHVLQSALAPDKMAYFQTGVLYQLLHAIGLILTGLTLRIFGCADRCLMWSGIAMTIGICAFSFSLYVFAVFDVKYITRLTPVGGIALIVSWILFILGVWRSRD